MKRKSWSRGDLIIAFYIAKFGLKGLNITRAELVKEVIGETTIKSLNMQAANFRFMLNIEGNRLSATSKNKLAIIEELGTRPIVFVRTIVLELIANSDFRMNRGIHNRNNKEAEKRKRGLNNQYALNFICNYKKASRYRVLRPVTQIQEAQGCLF